MTPFQMTPPIRMAAYAHAREEFAEGRESCGLVLKGDDGQPVYLPCENVHPDAGTEGVDAFRIDPAVYHEYAEDGLILAVIHSHPHGPAAPTKDDMISQRMSGVPWAIIVFDNGRIVEDFVFPAPLDVPMKGRMFRPGVDDCLTLIRRWHFQHDGFFIPDFARNPNWWLNDEGDGPGEDDMYLDLYEKAGFRRLESHEIHADPDDDRSPLVLKPGDIGLAKVLSPWKINHGVVYTGGQLMMHHLLNRASGEEPLSRWLSKVEVWLRRRDLDPSPEGAPHENDPPVRTTGD